MRLIALLLPVIAVAAAGAEPLADVPMDYWMTALFPILANYTLFDLSLPGTHDSMTWDLSTTVCFVLFWFCLFYFAFNGAACRSRMMPTTCPLRACMC